MTKTPQQLVNESFMVTIRQLNEQLASYRSHTWTPIEECGELEPGIYRVADVDVDSEPVCADAEYIELAGELQWFWLNGDGADPTHVLNVHLGPIPEAP